jgi:hypothetical protein
MKIPAGNILSVIADICEYKARKAGEPFLVQPKTSPDFSRIF